MAAKTGKEKRQENIKPFMIKKGQLSKEEARKRGSKGGKASVAAKKRRETFKESMEALLQDKLIDPDTRAKMAEMGLNPDEMTNQAAFIVTTLRQAMKGDTGAINIVREMVGERVQEISISTTVDEKVKELNDKLEKI